MHRFLWKPTRLWSHARQQYVWRWLRFVEIHDRRINHQRKEKRA